MSTLVVFIAILVYVFAIVMLWRERSLRYLLILLAGHLALLLAPLWQRLYQIAPTVGAGPALLGRFTVPWSVLLGGGPLLALPPLIFYYGLRHRWWSRHYASIWFGYLLFVAYFLLVEALLQRYGILLFSDALMVGNTSVPAAIVQAVLLGGVSLGMLYTLVSTRHYGLGVAFVPLLLFLGIFASPLWVPSLLDQSGLIVTSGAVVSLLLVLWGVHLLASALHAGRRQEFLWR
jgi:hypothetical protein